MCGQEMFKARVQTSIQDVNVFATGTFVNDVFICRKVRASYQGTGGRAKTSRLLGIT